MNKSIELQLQAAKKAALEVAAMSGEKKKALLLDIYANLLKHQKEITAANNEDITAAKRGSATGAFIDRLTLSEKGFAGMTEQLKIVAELDDPIGAKIEERTLPNGIELQKLRFPIGVILMIYESRPNVTVDVAGLCLKSGNAVILKGGKEAIKTNTILVACIHETLEKHGIDTGAVTFLNDVSHDDIADILKRSDMIDVVIPRGSYVLTTSVAEQSRIPILYHASGGARMFVDESADIEQAVEVCINAKTNRTGVCNALDMVLVHKNIAAKFLPMLDAGLSAKKFEMRADTTAKRYMSHAVPAAEEDFTTEFLDSILAVKVVDTSDEAITFIKKHTHHHTEVLAARDVAVIQRFVNEIDAAGLMINCSSRLNDGGEFGMGAEMGTATGKLHARGPVGVKELTTYKWIAYGDGQVK